MKNTYFLILLSVFISCSNGNDQKLGKVSLVFLCRDIDDSYTINDIKHELFVNELIDNIKTLGEEFAVIAIKMDSNYLMKLDLTVNDVRQAIKREINIPEVVTNEKSIILFKESDFENFHKYKDPNELMFIPIKKLNGDVIVKLSHVAKIYLTFHKEDLYYQENKVNIISFTFNGKSKDELKEVLKSIEKYRLKYKLVYR